MAKAKIVWKKAKHNFFVSDVVSYYEMPKNVYGEELIMVKHSNGEKGNMSKKRFEEMYIKI